MLKYILFLAKLKGEGRPFWSGQAYICLTCWDNVVYYKSVNHPIPTLSVGIGNTLAIFINKLVTSPFNWVSRNIHFLAKLNGTGRSFLFGGSKKGAILWDYPQEHLVVIRDENFFSFVKFEIILALLCYLLDPLTNKHCRTWSLVINLLIDSRTFQK